MAFEEMIDKIEVPMALMYGKEDPWVVPLWGHRIKRQRPDTLYYEVRLPRNIISFLGHYCCAAAHAA